MCTHTPLRAPPQMTEHILFLYRKHLYLTSGTPCNMQKSYKLYRGQIYQGKLIRMGNNY